MESKLERPDQIYLFGSRARGDWDGQSDTDLLVVVANQYLAHTWVDQVLDSGLAEDVIGLDHEAWAQLPKSASVVWRNAAKVAIPFLEVRSLMPGQMRGYVKPKMTSNSLNWQVWRKPAFTHHKPPKKA